MEEKKTTIKISVQTKIRLKKTAERLEKSGGKTSKTYEDAIKALIEYYELTKRLEKGAKNEKIRKNRA